jgi:hypothetical protein
MIRRLMLGAVGAVAIGFGGQAALAGEPVMVQPGTPNAFYPPRVDYDYIVLVKRGYHGPWEFYGRYETLHAARHAERRLERDGFRVRIEEVRERHHHW